MNDKLKDRLMLITLILMIGSIGAHILCAHLQIRPWVSIFGWSPLVIQVSFVALMAYAEPQKRRIRACSSSD